MANWIDHLVLASPSLDAGIDHVRTLLGVAPVFGGRHEGNGTHNALLSLGAPSYLEVLAPDPDQPPNSALIDASQLTSPLLHGFAIGSDDLDAAVAALRDAGVDGVSDPLPMTRRTDDGTELAWRLAFIGKGMGGARPFLISWGNSPSPADTSPAGGRLVSVRAGDPNSDIARRPLSILRVDVEVEESPTPWLRATIETPNGITVDLG